MRDPIVEEVREARMEHTRRFHSDLAAIFEDLRAHQKTCGHRIVRLPPRRLRASEGAEDVVAHEERNSEPDIPLEHVSEDQKQRGET